MGLYVLTKFLFYIRFIFYTNLLNLLCHFNLQFKSIYIHIQ